MREQKLQLVSVGSLHERSFLQKAGYENDELLKKCSYEGFNFICSNLPDSCTVEFTNHP